MGAMLDYGYRLSALLDLDHQSTSFSIDAEIGENLADSSAKFALRGGASLHALVCNSMTSIHHHHYN
jgi:hypothetical protein